MGLYLGSEKLKIITPSGVWNLVIYSPTPITNGIMLLSSDNYILKDSDGVYLTARRVNNYV